MQERINALIDSIIEHRHSDETIQSIVNAECQSIEESIDDPIQRRAAIENFLIDFTQASVDRLNRTLEGISEFLEQHHGY